MKVKTIVFHAPSPVLLSDKVNEWSDSVELEPQHHIASSFHFDGRQYWHTIVYAQKPKKLSTI